jgi:hypothetical protein
MMNRIGTTLAALGLCVAAAACQNPQQVIANKEDMMVAAGFKFVPANTPARQMSFKQLPPHKFAREIKDGRVFYVYPDPTVCVCLYVGDQCLFKWANVFRAGGRATDDRQHQLMNDWDWGPGGYPSGLVLPALALTCQNHFEASALVRARRPDRLFAPIQRRDAGSSAALAPARQQDKGGLQKSGVAWIGRKRDQSKRALHDRTIPGRRCPVLRQRPNRQNAASTEPSPTNSPRACVPGGK